MGGSVSRFRWAGIPRPSGASGGGAGESGAGGEGGGEEERVVADRAAHRAGGQAAGRVAVEVDRADQEVVAPLGGGDQLGERLLGRAALGGGLLEQRPA